MVALLRIYKDEDEAYLDLVTLATTFFQYLLQPFRDMRELAGLYKMEILVYIQIFADVSAVQHNCNHISLLQVVNLKRRNIFFMSFMRYRYVTHLRNLWSLKTLAPRELQLWKRRQKSGE